METWIVVLIIILLLVPMIGISFAIFQMRRCNVVYKIVSDFIIFGYTEATKLGIDADRHSLFVNFKSRIPSYDSLCDNPKYWNKTKLEDFEGYHNLIKDIEEYKELANRTNR